MKLFEKIISGLKKILGNDVFYVNGLVEFFQRAAFAGVFINGLNKLETRSS